MGKLLSLAGALAALVAAMLVSADFSPASAQRVKAYGECRRTVMADPRFMRRPGEDATEYALERSAAVWPGRRSAPALLLMM